MSKTKDLARVSGASGPPAPRGNRLRDLDFTDMLLSDSGKCLMRGVASGRDSPLVAIDDEMIVDLESLREAVMAQSQSEREFHLDFDGVRYRISVIEDLDGIWYAVRKPSEGIPRIGELGFPNTVVRHLGKLGTRSGLVLLAGATGQGKTTTAYSILNAYLHSFGDIAVTIEDPPELMLNGKIGNGGHCFQLKLAPGQTFGEALERSLRYTPRYILMGEIRRPHDAVQALRAAISGHLVLTTIHAGSVIEAINSTLSLTAQADANLTFAREQIANGLAGIIHQKLVRNPDPKAKRRRVLKAEILFAGGSASDVRALIRDGNTSQLSSAIEQQRSRVARGDDPIEMDRN